MADIVNRLRRHAEKAVGHWEDYANATDSIVREAADEIERLRETAPPENRAMGSDEV